MAKNSKGTQESCTCERCKDMCKRPCWGTPEDIKAIIECDYGHRLMADYWEADGASNNKHIDVLCPASLGSEGEDAPYFTAVGCTFQDENGLCELHDLGLKPTEGRLAFHDRDNDDGTHLRMALSWDTPEARQIIEDWRNEYD